MYKYTHTHKHTQDQRRAVDETDGKHTLTHAKHVNTHTHTHTYTTADTTFCGCITLIKFDLNKNKILRIYLVTRKIQNSPKVVIMYFSDPITAKIGRAWRRTVPIETSVSQWFQISAPAPLPVILSSFKRILLCRPITQTIVRP